MFTRKFIFSPNHTDLLDKDLYRDVTYKDGKALITLKENIKIGYANSFQEGVDYINEMSKYFVNETITEVKMFNGLCLLNGVGQGTHETVMNLIYDYYNYSLPDINKVTIEMKGLFNPTLYLKGSFTGEYKNSYTDDRVEFFSSISGAILDKDEMIQENLLTSFLIEKDEEGIHYELRYLGVKQDNGELFYQILISTRNKEELLNLGDKRYEKLIEKGLKYM